MSIAPEGRPMPTLSRIAVHPIKALDPVDMDRAAITDSGGLENDRAYAIVDDRGYVNGKRTATVHRLRADVDRDATRVTLESPERGPREFHLDDDREQLENWLSEYFGNPVTLKQGPGGTQTDGAVYGDGSQTGPTLTSEATLREVASWYDGIDAGEMRLRLRPNLVVAGVAPFWEDRLLADGGRQLQIGDVTLEAVKPLPRCVVPTRHPHTGVEYEGFGETFRERREATLPEGVDRAVFGDDLFKLTTLLRVPESDRGGRIETGAEVRVVDREPGN
jgi:uncharacterized protein YcbX